uniref:Uncharacterized protein n=1 Tax=Anguilla anguilla TaxID=7936 RepID=A0A0E9S6J8_ANGAN
MQCAHARACECPYPPSYPTD